MSSLSKLYLNARLYHPILEKDRCAKILVEESKTFLQGNNNDECRNSNNNNNDTLSTLDIIEFCIFDDQTLGYFENELADICNTRRNE